MSLALRTAKMNRAKTTPDIPACFQSNFSGYFPSAKIGRLVVYTSLLERDFIVLLEDEPTVETYYEALKPLAWSQGGKDWETAFEFSYCLPGERRILAAVKASAAIEEFWLAELYGLARAGARQADYSDLKLFNAREIRAMPRLANAEMKVFQRTPDAHYAALIVRAETGHRWLADNIIPYPVNDKRPHVRADIYAFLARFPADEQPVVSRPAAIKTPAARFDLEWPFSDFADCLEAKFYPSLEDPNFPRSDWSYEVANADTKLGYWEWLWRRYEADAGHGLEATLDRRRAAERARRIRRYVNASTAAKIQPANLSALIRDAKIGEAAALAERPIAEQIAYRLDAGQSAAAGLDWLLPSAAKTPSV